MTNENIFEALKKLHKNFLELYENEGILVGIQTDSVQVKPEFFAWLSEGENVQCNRNEKYIQLITTKDEVCFITLVG